VTNDIALLYLSQDVVFSSKIVPACLPTLATNTYANQMSIVSGKAHSTEVTLLNEETSC
jgi:hypothetical protein